VAAEPAAAGAAGAISATAVRMPHSGLIFMPSPSRESG
jgi:hypothetical protein